MVDHVKKDNNSEFQEVHQYYASILNCMPYLMYWIDEHCGLRGCNAKFIQLLGLRTKQDFLGSPYEKLASAAKWSKDVMEAFRLDDMAVIFSGQSLHDKVLSPIVYQDGTIHHFVCQRDPLLDQAGRVTGAVVVIMEVAEQRVPQTKPKVAAIAAPVTRTPRVLIVEDNEVAQQVEESLLLALNCEVDVANTGQRALALFQPGKYDLVIMDIGLEDTSGYVLSKQFRQFEKDTDFHVPIIALTSFQADLVKHDCNYYFMDGVISKPLTAEQAQQIVQHYIYHQNTIVNGLKYA